MALWLGHFKVYLNLLITADIRSDRRYSWNICKSLGKIYRQNPWAMPSEKFISDTASQFKKTVCENIAFLCILIYLVGSLRPSKPLVYVQKTGILQISI